ILGQILAGLVLVQLPGAVPGVLRGEVFASFSEVGLLCLLLLTGTGSRLGDIRRAGIPATLVALGGVFVPFAAGYAASLALGMTNPQALVVGALFSPTSIGITALVLLEAHRLRTAVGATLVGAAILDDVIALGLLAVVLGTGSPLQVLVKAVAFFSLAGLFGWQLLPRLYQGFRRVHLPEAPLTFVFIVAFTLAAAAESVGLAAITGAFLAGLAIGERMGEEKLLAKVHAVAYSLFIPLFFVHLGATLDLGKVAAIGHYAPLLLAASFGGKFLGAGAGALAARLPPVRALQVGLGMLPRLEVSLVVVAVAIRQGVFQGALADVMIGVALLNMSLSLLFTPLLLRAAFRLEPEAEPHHPTLPDREPAAS
ncbi:MAG TPA: cation:proton antiporter, partial [Deferrisomatales bacterium]|nr:cation:proton antiporter [Deferrisomatales bacterium]